MLSSGLPRRHFKKICTNLAILYCSFPIQAGATCPETNHNFQLNMIARSRNSHENPGKLANLWPPWTSIDWRRLGFTAIQPVLAFVIGAIWVPLKLETVIFSFVYATMSGLSITAGKIPTAFDDRKP